MFSLIPGLSYCLTKLWQIDWNFASSSEPPNDKLSCRAATINPNPFVRSEQIELSSPLRGQLQRRVSRAPHPNSSLPNNQIALLLYALSYAGSVRSGLAGGYATLKKA